MEQSKLFRKAAMEKLSSPERLDVLMKVTSPGGWIALWAIGFLLLALVVWGVVGSIAIKVEGKGILIRGGTVLEVGSLGAGRISEILVKPGDVVKPGQVVATLSLPDLQQRIANTREEIASLTGQGVSQRAAQGAIQARLQRQAAELREKIAQQEKLAARGLITRNQVMATRQELTSTEMQLAQGQFTEAGMSNRLDDARRQLRELETQLATNAEVKSPYEGRVIELGVNPGDLVAAGTGVATLEPVREEIRAIIYIPAQEGKKVQPGMQAYIAPSTVQPEEYGFMLGEVKSVSDYPASPEALLRVLRNAALVETLTGRNAPIEITAALIPDSSTTSGFKWSSSSGPPMKVFSGTICSASVQVASKRPISYVLPIFKRAVGAS
jgi:HlyD family secretion protein